MLARGDGARGGVQGLQEAVFHYSLQTIGLDGLDGTTMCYCNVLHLYSDMQSTHVPHSAGIIHPTGIQIHCVYRNKARDVRGTIRWHTLLKSTETGGDPCKGWGGNPLSLLMLF